MLRKTTVIDRVLRKGIRASAAGLAAIALALVPAALPGRESALERPAFQIGYTTHRTNLPGGYYPNRVTSRAFVVRGDGNGTTELAPGLASKPHQFTQFGGWSPDGRQAVLYQIWESRRTALGGQARAPALLGGALAGGNLILLNMQTKKTTNLTAVERVSFYNGSLHFWPEKKFSFSAMIGGHVAPSAWTATARTRSRCPPAPASSTAFRPRRTASGFVTTGTTGCTSPTPTAATPNRSRTLTRSTSSRFGRRPHMAGVSLGRALQLPPVPPTPRWDRLAETGGPRRLPALMQPIDKGTDGHSERSDPLTWSPDGKWLYYTAKVGKAVELMRVSPTGRPEQLTRSRPGVVHYLRRFRPIPSGWCSARRGRACARTPTWPAGWIRGLSTHQGEGRLGGPSTHSGGPGREEPTMRHLCLASLCTF